MSLKVFHIAFITLSVALALGCGVWTIQGYARTGESQYLWGIAISFVAALFLLLYEIWVIGKFRGMKSLNMRTSRN